MPKTAIKRYTGVYLHQLMVYNHPKHQSTHNKLVESAHEKQPAKKTKNTEHTQTTDKEDNETDGARLQKRSTETWQP